MLISLLLLSPVLLLADECTKSCDLQYPGGNTVKMCGTDYQTHVTHSDAFYDNTCYDLCGIMTQYEGICGCPHDCYSEVGHGICSDNLCACSSDWSGYDCSLPSDSNKCSLHGKAIEPADKDSEFPFVYCVCDEGFTGSDCSSPEIDVGTMPWSNIYDEKIYYDDEYGDNHPVWNISVFATVRVNIKESDYINLLLPENLYNESYASATIHFDNGHVKETIDNVGFRVKGQGGRMDQKKGWAMKFNKFVSGQKLLDIKKMGFKGCSEKDSFVKIQVATDLYRAMSVPAQRSSYALLYINEIFAGLYFMHEDISDDFTASRYAGNGEGNLMQLYFNVHFAYFGTDDTYYRDKVYVNDLGYPMHYYDQTDGNDNWYDFTEWLQFFNTSTDAEFVDQIETFVDIPSLFRSLATEAFLLSSDDIASGNNIYVYHQVSDGKEQQMSIFTYDFEDVFNFDPITQEPLQNPDIFEFFGPERDKYEEINPLTTRLFAIEKYRSLYVDTMETLVEAVCGSASKQQVSSRFASIFQFVLPWVARDKLWQLSYGITVEEFVVAAESSIAHFPLRYQNVTAQIASFNE